MDSYSHVPAAKTPHPANPADSTSSPSAFELAHSPPNNLWSVVDHRAPETPSHIVAKYPHSPEPQIQAGSTFSRLDSGTSPSHPAPLPASPAHPEHFYPRSHIPPSPLDQHPATSLATGHSHSKQSPLSTHASSIPAQSHQSPTCDSQSPAP
jgi:hypothetical protein